MLPLVITYIWIGTAIPEDYLISLSNVSYPVQVLINPPTNDTLQLNIQKADRYRLEFLKNGGIYADFDVKIVNYECLMRVLSNFTGEMMVQHFEGPGWENKRNNGFMYVPANNTGLVR
jgi:hypothetical protein